MPRAKKTAKSTAKKVAPKKRKTTKKRAGRKSTPRRKTSDRRRETKTGLFWDGTIDFWDGNLPTESPFWDKVISGWKKFFESPFK
jgi:hypothetical protein